ncbi:MAG TPA: FG-GAP-like repeat-containing protein, partial [Chitinophagaceae bacterium]|nr:FG-GAP-like repeat-containing protein [Chitinophagaceae bacterium]
KADFAAGPTPTGVAIADLNGDGQPDLAVTNGANNTVYVLRNTSAAGALSFDPAAGYGTGTYPYSVALNDLDGDGLPDMLIANRDNNNISIIRNTVKAPAVFSFNPQFAASGSVVTIAGQHFTGATAVSFGGTAAASFTVNTDSTITATVGTGASGSVAVTTPYGTATLGGFAFTTLPVIRSFTPKRGGPGTTITLIGNNFTGTTSVKFSSTAPSASFTINTDTSITVVAGAMPPAMDSIIVTNAYGTRSTAWFYAGPYITSFTPASGPIGATVTINGNNFSATAANNTVYFGAVKAVVSAATATSLTVIVPPGATYQPITVTTNNLTTFSPQPFVVTFGPGGTAFTAGSFAAKTDLPTPVFPADVFSADIDGDGKPDLVEVNQNANTVSVFRNTGFGSGIAFAARVDFATGSSPFGLTIGDINGDGKPDLVVTNIDGSASSISVLKNTSTPGTVSFATKLDYATGNSIGSYPQSASISDLDGDGAPDIAVVNSDGTLSLFRNRSGASGIYFDYRLNYAIAGGPQSVAIGDLDGDGLPDIAVANTSSSANPSITIFRNTSVPGAFSFVATTNIPTGNGPYSVSIGDLDGDGKPDMAVADANTFFDGLNYFYNVSVIKNTSTSGNISFAPKLDYHVSNYPSWVSISDLDGDGKPDLAVANRDGGISGTGNSVSVLRNTCTGGTMSFDAKADYATGVNPLSVSISDIDGDGKPDIITTNNSSNTISILRNLMATGAPKPTVSSFTPVSAGTGTTVTIRGTHFAGATAVGFGGVSAASYTVVSDTVVTAVVGAGATGFVRVTTSAGTDSLAGFTFIPPTPAPKISSFTPTSAATGAIVTIKGVHFTGAVLVSFGG